MCPKLPFLIRTCFFLRTIQKTSLRSRRRIGLLCGRLQLLWLPKALRLDELLRLFRDLGVEVAGGLAIRRLLVATHVATLLRKTLYVVYVMTCVDIYICVWITYACRNRERKMVKWEKWSSNFKNYYIYIYTIYAYMFINYRNTNKDIVSYENMSCIIEYMIHMCIYIYI